MGLLIASSSALKLKLLNRLYPAYSVPSEDLQSIDLDQIKNEKTFEYCKRSAKHKVLNVWNKYPNHYIIGSHTILIKGAKFFGKATNYELAEQYLKLLSGHKHRIVSAVSVGAPNQKKISTKIVSTTIAFKRLDINEIKSYIQTNQWSNQIGAYDIQGYADSFIKQIIGSYTNILGLPLQCVNDLLRGLGYVYKK